MMLKTHRSFSTIMLIAILVLTGATVYSISMQTQNALMGAEQEKLIAIASTTASQIDGDAFNRIGPGDESTSAFYGIRDQLRRIKESNPDIKYIYTFRTSGDGVAFVVDGDYGYMADAAMIGQVYPEPEPEILEGFVAPTADRQFTSDQWGTVLSGFAPVRDHAGTVVGVVGVDMDVSTVKVQLDRLNMVFYAVALILILLASMVLIIVERRRAADEQKIAESEKKYRLLFEQASDCILILEADGENKGKIIAANAAAARMHGYTVEELLEKNISDLDTRSSRELVAGRFAQIQQTGVLTGQAMHVRKDGTEFPIEINAGLLDLGTKKYILTIDRDYSERKKAEDALQQVTSKLSFLNFITFNDIQNATYILAGFLSIAQSTEDRQTIIHSLDKIDGSVRTISRMLEFAQSYQNLGVHPAKWQQVHQTFIFALSHLDFSRIDREVSLGSLEIYADPLLERVFFSLAHNVMTHAETATRVRLGYTITGTSLVISFEDNGRGIPVDLKQKIFERGYGSHKGMELFLVRQILSITGITIIENGDPGNGARFEITVPKGAWRFGEEQ